MPKEVSPAFIRTQLCIPISAVSLAGTGAITIADQLPTGFKFSVESVRFLTTVLLVGAGGVQTFEVRKGATTGTLLASVAPAIATEATVGTHKVGEVAAAAESAAYVGSDAGTISIVRAAGGTAFSAGEGVLLINLRQRQQSRR